MLVKLDDWYESLKPAGRVAAGNTRILKNLQFDLVGQASPAGEAHIASQLQIVRSIVAGETDVRLHVEARRTYQPAGRIGQYRRTVLISQISEGIDLPKLTATINSKMNVYTKITVPCPVKK